MMGAYDVIAICLPSMVRSLAKDWNKLDWENHKTQSSIVDDNLNDIEQHLKFLEANFNWIETAYLNRNDVEWRWIFDGERNKRFRRSVMSIKVRS